MQNARSKISELVFWAFWMAESKTEKVQMIVCKSFFSFFELEFIGNFKKIYFNFTFWQHCVANGILVPRPGIEPVPPALGARSLNHGTAREASCKSFFG